jgi:hypothetical protein
MDDIPIQMIDIHMDDTRDEITEHNAQKNQIKST